MASGRQSMGPGGARPSRSDGANEAWPPQLTSCWSSCPKRPSPPRGAPHTDTRSRNGVTPKQPRTSLSPEVLIRPSVRPWRTAMCCPLLLGGGVGVACQGLLKPALVSPEWDGGVRGFGEVVFGECLEAPEPASGDSQLGAGGGQGGRAGVSTDAQGHLEASAGIWAHRRGRPPFPGTPPPRPGPPRAPPALRRGPHPAAEEGAGTTSGGVGASSELGPRTPSSHLPGQ